MAEGGEGLSSKKSKQTRPRGQNNQGRGKGRGDQVHESRSDSDLLQNQ